MARSKGGILVVERPPVGFWQRLFLPTVLWGLWFDLCRLVRRFLLAPAIIQEGSRSETVVRGTPVLLRDPAGRIRCSGCQLCEFACPSRAIGIVPGGLDSGMIGRYTNEEKVPRRFEFDLLRCISCGHCQEVCPEQAIVLSQDLGSFASTREELILDLEEMLRRGERAGEPRDEERRSG